MDPLKFPIKKATSDTSTIIISRDEFTNRAAMAIAKSDFIQSLPHGIAVSLLGISAILLADIEEELFGEGGEKL